jgi:hypothetical protein
MVGIRPLGFRRKAGDRFAARQELRLHLPNVPQQSIYSRLTGYQE